MVRVASLELGQSRLGRVSDEKDRVRPREREEGGVKQDRTRKVIEGI